MVSKPSFLGNSTSMEPWCYNQISSHPYLVPNYLHPHQYIPPPTPSYVYHSSQPPEYTPLFHYVLPPPPPPPSPHLYTPPFTLTYHTTLSTGQPYYAIETIPSMTSTAAIADSPKVTDNLPIDNTVPASNATSNVWNQMEEKLTQLMESLEKRSKILADLSEVVNKDVSKRTVKTCVIIENKLGVKEDGVGKGSDIGEVETKLKSGVEDDNVSVLGGNDGFKGSGDASDGSEEFRREEGSEIWGVLKERDEDEGVAKEKGEVDDVENNDSDDDMCLFGYALKMFDESPEPQLEIAAPQMFKASIPASHDTNSMFVLAEANTKAVKVNSPQQLRNNDKVIVYKLHENGYGKIDSEFYDNFKNMINAAQVFDISSETECDNIMLYKLHENEYGKIYDNMLSIGFEEKLYVRRSVIEMFVKFGILDVARQFMMKDCKTVAQCLNANRIVDALIIAHVGGASLWDLVVKELDFGSGLHTEIKCLNIVCDVLHTSEKLVMSHYEFPLSALTLQLGFNLVEHTASLPVMLIIKGPKPPENVYWFDTKFSNVSKANVRNFDPGGGTFIAVPAAIARGGGINKVSLKKDASIAILNVVKVLYKINILEQDFLVTTVRTAKSELVMFVNRKKSWMHQLNLEATTAADNDIGKMFGRIPDGNKIGILFWVFSDIVFANLVTLCSNEFSCRDLAAAFWNCMKCIEADVKVGYPGLMDAVVLLGISCAFEHAISMTFSGNLVGLGKAGMKASEFMNVQDLFMDGTEFTLTQGLEMVVQKSHVHPRANLVIFCLLGESVIACFFSIRWVAKNAGLCVFYYLNLVCSSSEVGKNITCFDSEVCKIVWTLGCLEDVLYLEYSSEEPSSFEDTIYFALVRYIRLTKRTQLILNKVQVLSITWTQIIKVCELRVQEWCLKSVFVIAHKTPEFSWKRHADWKATAGSMKCLEYQQQTISPNGLNFGKFMLCDALALLTVLITKSVAIAWYWSAITLVLIQEHCEFVTDAQLYQIEFILEDKDCLKKWA